MKLNFKNNFKEHNLLISLVLAGIFFRIVLNNVAYSNDAEAFVFWGYYLKSHSITSLFETLPGGYTPYPPLYYYLTRAIAVLDSFINVNKNIWFTYLLFKVPTILSEVVVTTLIYKLVLKNFGKKPALISAAFYFLNPAAIYNTAIFGQTDSLISGLAFIAIVALSNKLYLIGLVSYALAFLIKLQALALLPLVIILTLSQKKLSKLVKYILVISILCISPFLIILYDKGLVWTISYFRQLPNWYPYTSIYTYNLWSFKGFIVPDSQKLFYLFPYKYLSQFLFWIIALAILSPLNRKKSFNFFSVTFAAFLLFFDFAFFETRVHSRYLLYTLPFASYLLFVYPRQIILLNIIMLANLLLPLNYAFLKPLTIFLNNKIVIIIFIFVNLTLFINMYLNYRNNLKGRKLRLYNQ